MSSLSQPTALGLAVFECFPPPVQSQKQLFARALSDSPMAVVGLKLVWGRDEFTSYLPAGTSFPMLRELLLGKLTLFGCDVSQFF